MPSLSRRTMLSIVCALAAGTALRLWFIHAFPQIQGDSLLYADIARNWLTHGIYGRSLIHPPTIAPTLVRLPGYPAFLALCFAVFGKQNYLAVLYLQVVIDLAACLLIADFVRRICGHRAAMAALWLAALCPFTANYVAMPLTETPSIFCVALGLCAFAAVLERPRLGWMLALAFAWSYAALLRPDGALLGLVFFPALIFYGGRPLLKSSPGSFWKQKPHPQPALSSRLPRRAVGPERSGAERSAVLPPLGFSKALRVALFCGLIAVLPFGIWTLRNWHTFHAFQPLAPRSATDPGEPKALGFQRWAKTWIADFASTYEVYWNVPGDEIDIHTLPPRALDGDKSETTSLIAQYNAADALTPQIDARFDAIAAERIQAHPVRYYLTLPLMRLADMWLRPRVEMLNIELRWWQYNQHRAETRIAYAYGALNLLYLLAGVVGVFYWPRFVTALVAYIVIRSLLLSTLEAPEPRYTLECFPMIIAFAAAALARLTGRQRLSGPFGQGNEMVQ